MALSHDIEKLFAVRRIVVFGDLVADQFLNGTISRVSREAPVFILRHDTTETRPGAAANTAANINSLGGTPVLIGLAGTDPNADLLISALKERNIETDGIIVEGDLRTVTKIRVLAGQHYAPKQQVIRIDYENDVQIASETKKKLIGKLSDASESADAVVLSDYGYGVVDEEAFAVAREINGRKQIPLLIDSRFSLSKFRGASSATPNQEEVEQMLGRGFSAMDCELLRKRLNHQALLVTRGNEGMILAEDGCDPLVLDAVGGKLPVDVTGAGDTVIATYALGLAAGMSFAEAANAANHAGGIVVMKKGTATVSPGELTVSLAGHTLRDTSHAAG